MMVCLPTPPQCQSIDLIAFTDICSPMPDGNIPEDPRVVIVIISAVDPPGFTDGDPLDQILSRFGIDGGIPEDDQATP